MKLLQIFTASAILWAGAVAGQNDDSGDANWYTVEVIVFRYLEDSNSEEFPLLPELEYPLRMQSLNSGPTTLELEQSFALLRPEDRLPAVAFDLSSLPKTPALPVIEPGLERAPGIQPDYSVPAAFAQLDVSEREYNSERLRINRRKDMRVLFHQAWRQPVLNRERAWSIQLQTKNENALEDKSNSDYPSLQGTIMLYVSRYLHLETNLWLNKSRSDLPRDWAMPAPPLPPQEKELENYEFKLTHSETLQPITSRTQLDELASILLEEIPTTELAVRRDSSGQPIEKFDEEEFLQRRFYAPYNHALLLQQKRRMRSGELHYIDHPQLGIIIKLTPFTFDPVLPPVTELSQR
jgi:hypothetical protein